MEALDKQFGVTEAGTTVDAEIRAGVTTFLTMAYILLVNPAMLSIDSSSRFCHSKLFI
jgi:AGZA family xanthine/uracil permease-like MFS transporter